MCTACGNGLVLLNGTCTPSVTITGAWWSDDLSSLNFAFSSQVKFYNKAKAAPAPSGVMCFNQGEGDVCSMDWNQMNPTDVQNNLNIVLNMLPPPMADIIKKMTQPNATQSDNYDPNLPPQPTGFASPANVVKKLFCNRFNLFGNFSQPMTQAMTQINA